MRRAIERICHLPPMALCLCVCCVLYLYNRTQWCRPYSIVSTVFECIYLYSVYYIHTHTHIHDGCGGNHKILSFALATLMCWKISYFDSQITAYRIYIYKSQYCFFITAPIIYVYIFITLKFIFQNKLSSNIKVKAEKVNKDIVKFVH